MLSGIGVGVVDGTLAADTAWIRRRPLVVEEYRVVEKTTLVCLPNGNTLIVPTPDDRRRAACLPETWLRRIASLDWRLKCCWVRRRILMGDCRRQIWYSRVADRAVRQATATRRVFSHKWDDEAARHSLWTLSHPTGGKRCLLPLERDEVAVEESMREKPAVSLAPTAIRR